MPERHGHQSSSPSPPPTFRPPAPAPTSPVRLRGTMEAWQVSLLPAMSLLGALAISFLALSTGNWLGRRTELLLAAFIYGEPQHVTHTHTM